MTDNQTLDQSVRINNLRLSIVKSIIAADDSEILNIHSSLKDEPCHDGSRLYSLVETSKLLGISRQTLWRMLKQGRIVAVGTTGSRKRISGLALHNFISGR
jgi:excisionase family DNA binding protein